MALQSQTHPNSGNSYYITNYAPSFNPSTNVSLRSPVEIIFTSTIQTEFYGYLDQTPSTFTISENNANLSTINSLVFDGANSKTTMNVYDVNNAIAEPVIQQWSHTSSIVNGIFKVGNKQLNDEPNALNMVNSGNQTVLSQGSNITINIDGVNQRVIYSQFQSPGVYTAIGTGGGSVPIANVRCANDPAGNAIQISPTVVSFNAGGAGAFTPYGRTGVGNIAPNTYFMTARTGIDFVVDDVSEVLTPLSLKQDGTVTMISTLTVPVLKQGNITQTIDGTNTRNRFANVADAATAYVEINQIPAAPSLIVLNTQAQMKITPSTIAISNFSASPSQVAKIGTIPSFPGTFMLESYSDTQIRTNINGYSTATFKADGTTELLSTLTVPSIVMNENNIQYASIDIASFGTKPLVIAAKSYMYFQVDTAGVPKFPLQLNQNGNALFASTMTAPYIECYDIYLQQIIAFNENTAVPVKASLTIQEQPYGNVPAGSNYLQSPRIRLKDTFISPKVFYPAGNSESQIIQNTLQASFGAPTNAANSMEFVNNSQNTSGGFQFFHATDGNTPVPEWLGGFTYNPKQFILAPTLNLVATTANLTNISSTNISTTNIVGTNANLTNLSTTQINAVNNPIDVNGSLEISKIAGSFGVAGANSLTSPRLVASGNNASPPTYVPQAQGDGQIIQNVLRTTYGSPVDNSMEFIQNSPQNTGGFQFYHADDASLNTPVWLGGFSVFPLKFILPSTMIASLPLIADTQSASITALTNVSTASILALTNLSSINALPISYFGNPIGTMISWAGQYINSIPAGYLLCDGSEYNIAGIYNALYNVIGSWGQSSHPGVFKVPDSRGKMLAGSVTSTNNPGPAGSLTISAIFQGVCTVTLPASFGGGTRVGMYVQNPTGQLMEGMQIISPLFSSLFIQGFINSDGRFGSYTPAVTNRDIVIIFESSLLSYPGTGGVIQFAVTGANLTAFPYIGFNWNPVVPALGTGWYANVQKSYEIAPHTHQTLQPGGSSSQIAGAQNRAGDPNIGGPNTLVNNELFSYVERVSQTTVSGTMALYNIPYNVATWQIIKY
jgi:hypothetical protein